MTDTGPRSHLTDAELFGYAIPAVGSPEALPSHLSDCLSCSRALQQWKSAVRELARDTGSLDRRTPGEWKEAEGRTMDAIRGTRLAGSTAPLRWAVGVAASLLLAALLLPLRGSGVPGPSRTAASASELSSQDQADDALLRDVARLSRAEDAGGSWNTLVPETGMAGREEELL